MWRVQHLPACQEKRCKNLHLFAKHYPVQHTWAEGHLFVQPSKLGNWARNLPITSRKTSFSDAVNSTSTTHDCKGRRQMQHTAPAHRNLQHVNSPFETWNWSWTKMGSFRSLSHHTTFFDCMKRKAVESSPTSETQLQLLDLKLETYRFVTCNLLWTQRYLHLFYCQKPCKQFWHKRMDIGHKTEYDSCETWASQTKICMSSSQKSVAKK